MEQSSPEKLVADLLADPRLSFLPRQNTELWISKLAGFCLLWQKWNKKTSLTAEREMGLYIRKHLFVSLQFAHALDYRVAVVDIGSGAGLPGIPLKILFPDLPMLLVECRRKRANYLKQVVRELSLQNIAVFDCKVEEMGEPPFIIDTAVFRAVAETDTCLEMAHCILQLGGRVVLLRTPKEVLTVSNHSDYSREENIEIEDFEGNPLILACYRKEK